MAREMVVKQFPDFAGKVFVGFSGSLRVAGVSLVCSTRVVPLFRLLNCYAVKAVNPR